jgi:hypothetical protein
MRFVVAAVTFFLSVAFLPCQVLPATLHVKLRPVHVQNAKKPVKK